MGNITINLRSRETILLLQIPWFDGTNPIPGSNTVCPASVSSKDWKFLRAEVTGFPSPCDPRTERRLGTQQVFVGQINELTWKKYFIIIINSRSKSQFLHLYQHRQVVMSLSSYILYVLWWEVSTQLNISETLQRRHLNLGRGNI